MKTSRVVQGTYILNLVSFRARTKMLSRFYDSRLKDEIVGNAKRGKTRGDRRHFNSQQVNESQHRGQEEYSLVLSHYINGKWLDLITMWHKAFTLYHIKSTLVKSEWQLKGMFFLESRDEKFDLMVVDLWKWHYPFDFYLDLRSWLFRLLVKNRKITITSSF